MSPPRRVIMRIEVSAGVPERLDRTVTIFGSTHVSTVSRLLNCVVKQDEETLATILGLMPKGAEVNATAKILESIRKAKS